MYFYKGVSYSVFWESDSNRWYYRIPHYNKIDGPFASRDMAIMCAEAYIDSREQ